MLIAVLGVLALLSVPAARGRLHRVADLHLRGTWVVFVAVAVQVLIISVVPEGDGTLHGALHIATYGVALGWLLWNWTIPSRWVLAAGGALNFVAIAANGGVMPATRAAVAAHGGHASGFTNSAAVHGSHLAFLGDIITVPSWVPLANAFSIGDILILLGAVIIVHVLCESWIGLPFWVVGQFTKPKPDELQHEYDAWALEFDGGRGLQPAESLAHRDPLLG